MLIRVNTYIVILVLGLILGHSFDFQSLIGAKMPLFLELRWAHQYILTTRKKDILILGKGPTQRLDSTNLTAEAENSINFSRSNIKFCLSLHYNKSNSFLFVNATKIYQFKRLKKHSVCLKNIAGDFSANNEKTGLN